MLRQFALTLCVLFNLIIGVDALAASSQDARQYVDAIGKQVLQVVNGPSAETQKQQQLRQLFSQNVDTDWMGRFVLGRAWNQASDEQKSRYLAAYRDYMLGRYTTNFREYAGSDYTITDAKASDNGQYFVGMQVKAPNAEDSNVRAGYRVHEENGKFRIIDIVVEGVSQLTTQRSEFASIVQQGGMERLIEKLQTHQSSKS